MKKKPIVLSKYTYRRLLDYLDDDPYIVASLASKKRDQGISVSGVEFFWDKESSMKKPSNKIDDQAIRDVTGRIIYRNADMTKKEVRQLLVVLAYLIVVSIHG